MSSISFEKIISLLDLISSKIVTDKLQSSCKILSKMVLQLLILQLILQMKEIDSSLSPGGQPMLIIGLFQQNCSSTNSSNHTLTDSTLCQAAIEGANTRKQEFWRFMIRQAEYRINGKMNVDDFEYEAKSFCHQQEAVQFLIDVKLNQSYYINNATQGKPKWNELDIQNWRFTSRVIQIIIYSEDVATSNIFRSVLYGEDFIVTFINHNLADHFGGSNIDINANFLDYNAKRLMAQINSEFAERFYDRKNDERRNNDVHYIGIIYIPGSSLIYEKEFEYFYQNYVMTMYQELKLCHFVYNLNISDANDVNNLAKNLINDTDLKFLILYGSPEDQHTLYAKYRQYRDSLKSRPYPKLILLFHDVGLSLFDDAIMLDKRYSFNAGGYKFILKS